MSKKKNPKSKKVKIPDHDTLCRWLYATFRALDDLSRSKETESSASELVWFQFDEDHQTDKERDEFELLVDALDKIAREEEEKRDKKRQDLKEKALKKLTKEEREAVLYKG